MDEVIKCGLGLSKGDFIVLKELLKNSGTCFTAEMLAKKTCQSLTTVQRATKKLHARGVVIRRQENLDGGGYSFWYSVDSKDRVRKVLLETIDGWSAHVKKELNSWV